MRREGRIGGATGAFGLANAKRILWHGTLASPAFLGRNA